MRKLKLWSTWLGLLEDLVYCVPTLTTILYYYFSTIQDKVSQTSQYSFALALTLFVLFVIYRKVAKTKISELRQSVVQTETDLKNTPDSQIEYRKKLAENAKKDRIKLDTYDRGMVIISLLIIALAINIMEKAAIGLTTLSYIALLSVLAGEGIHIGVLALKEKEAVKLKK